MNLDSEQLSLLADLVQASRKTPAERRESFISFQVMGADPRMPVSHPGLPEGYWAHPQDIQLLERAGCIAFDSTYRRDVWGFFVTPEGFRFYEEMKLKEGTSTEHVEVELRRYFESERFQQRYPVAYGKWVLAESLLWGDDSVAQLSAIGHHCREALQDFTSALVERYKPADVEPDPKKTINRLQAVLRATAAVLGTAEAGFLKILLEYWKVVDGLVQRQEHAGQKEGRPVTWEDARRVVFQTMNLLYEVDQSLGGAKGTG